MRAILTDNPFLRATVTNFFFFLSLNNFILLPLYIHQQGGTEVEIGVVMGLYNAVGIVCQPLVGPWIDALGRRPFMLAGVGLLGVSALVAALMPSIAALALVRLMQGLGFSAFFVANYSYVIDLVPPARRGWALGIYGVSGLAATAIAPLAGEQVVRALGFRPLFLLATLLAGVAFVLVTRLPGGGGGSAAPVTTSLWQRGGLDEVWRRPMAVTWFFGLGSGTIWVFLPTFAESLGVRTLALFYTAYAAAAIGVRIFGGGLLDTRGRAAVIVPSMFAQALGGAVLAMLAFLFARVEPMAVLLLLFLAGLISGCAHGFLYPGLAALVTDETPATRRGVVVGIFSAVFLVGQTSGAFVFGWVTHAAGYAVTWAALTVVLLAGAGVSLGLSRGGRGGSRDILSPRRRAGEQE